MAQPNELFPGIFEWDGKLLTKNLVPGNRSYDESQVTLSNVNYRIWNAYHSKLAAGIKKGLNELRIKEGAKVLYLGCAEGKTVSHLSDAVGKNGLIFGVDISARAMQSFMKLTESRENVLPVLADADQPDAYADHLKGQKIDLLFQDVAQKNQAEILCKNAQFLEKGGQALLSLKARSVQSHVDPKEILRDEIEVLEKVFEVRQVLNLAPFEDDHYLIDCRKK